MQNQSVKTNSSMRVDLKRETLPAQISKHLLQHITDQNMKPGDLLPSVTSLATEFSVSHPVIREALQALSALGVITVLKGKGAIIKSVDDESLRIFFQRVQQTEANPIVSLMEVRIPLEIQSAMLAAQRHTHEDIWTLENIITEMSQSLENASRTIALDTEFHLAISQATHNRILLYLINSTRNALKDSMIALRKKREEKGQIGEEQRGHEAILKEIKEGNAEGASAAMRAHLNEVLSLLNQID